MNQELKAPVQAPARKSGRLHPIHVVVAGGDEAQRSTLQEALNQISELEIDFISEEEAGRRGERGAILMLILDSAHPDYWRQEVRRHNFDRRFGAVVALLEDDSPNALRRALQAGADDVLGMPPAPGQAYHTLFRISELSHSREGLQEKMLCSLVSVSGGVGVSHLTVNLALAMHRLFEKRTGIVELDLQAAPLTVLLNQDSEHTIAELADPTSAIDSIRLESVLCKHDSGLYWLSAPKRIEEAELISAATVEATLRVMRELFDVVLVDCGAHLTESSIVVWERSDHLLYVVDQTVTAIRAAQRFLDLYQRLGLRDVRPAFVLNRYMPASPITRERIEAALGQAVYASIPRDEKSYSEQQVSGQDLWKIRSAGALCHSIEQLARQLYGADANQQGAARAGLLAKLRAALTQ